jgi:hypothetical protein
VKTLSLIICNQFTATSSLANVVNVRTDAQRRARLTLISTSKRGRSFKEPIASSGPKNAGAHRERAWTGAVSNFVHAHCGRHATAGRESLRSGEETELSPTDFIAIGLIFLSAASGPLLAWLLFRTAF